MQDSYFKQCSWGEVGGVLIELQRGPGFQPQKYVCYENLQDLKGHNLIAWELIFSTWTNLDSVKVFHILVKELGKINRGRWNKKHRLQFVISVVLKIESTGENNSTADRARALHTADP